MGPTGLRQDDDHPTPGRPHRPGLRTGLGDLLRDGRPAQGLRRRGPPPRDRAGNALLFVDEIHRFNRAQQDSFLPYVEDGTVVLVGATTENPSFELNGALLSRCQVMVLRRLDKAALSELLARAESLTGRSLALTEEARTALLSMADGDGGYLLGMVEQVLAAQEAGDPEPLDVEGLRAWRVRPVRSCRRPTSSTPPPAS